MSAERWSPREMRLREWVLSHPGACKEISLRLKVSAEYVRLVLYGKRGKKGSSKVGVSQGTSDKMKAIIRMLKQKGAPI